MKTFPVRLSVGALAVLSAVSLTSCASNDETAESATTSAAGAASEGTVPAGEPDINGDGKVVVGVLSPGDIHDKGYYQSFVDAADTFAKDQGWEVISRGSVAPTDALNAARALCQQGVDLVALGASELSDAIPASTEAVCAKTAWYVPSSENVEQTPEIFLSSDNPAQDMLAAGYAAGLYMQEKNSTQAGFIAGPEADYSTAAARAYEAGIKLVVPDATVSVTFNGDANDPAKGRESAQAQISQGVSITYPYLGGATDAVAELANEAGVAVLTPGTDRCDSTSPTYDISVIFSPGDYLTAGLEQFAAGTLAMGVEKVWQMGVDPFPTVKLCDATADEQAKIDEFEKKMGTGEIDAEAEVAKLG
ncbi:BMP family ABC transporter substrate-binding protein [Kineosporia sp. J2-2]|uniref:BMP family ABC transporter substrate-binding protein n=1 Tax=Kineosporia corallincola TaxID=2835133 RepID=A0ABS5TN80_9ACTN|nr:BMP family ABC transporter substrate-binding protein [Kineosporia corallincola]MBT0772450.1 BMP family ABC transporter substrate-binding protein [Kineosporia corallincola]